MTQSLPMSLLASLFLLASMEVAVPVHSGSAEPFLFATKDRVLLSWLEPSTGNRSALRFLRLGDTTPRTIAERVDLLVNWADFPSVVEDAKGTLYAHWLQKSSSDPHGYDIWVTTSRDDGKSWSQPFLLNRNAGTGEHGFVTLAPLPSGGVAATWLDDGTLQYTTIDARGATTAPVQLDGRTCECCTTGMALAGGRPVIAYRDRSMEEVRDIAVVAKTANGWSQPHAVHADQWKINGCPVNGPQVAASGKRVAVAWYTGAADRKHVYVAFSDDGGMTFGAPVGIDDGKPVGRVDVVMVDASSAVVTWLEETPSGAEIRARRVPAKGAPASSVKIADSSTARRAGFPRIAAVGHDVYFAWTDATAIRVTRERF